eukprot:23224_1
MATGMQQQHSNHNNNMYGAAQIAPNGAGSGPNTPNQRYHSNSNGMRLNSGHLQVSSSPVPHVNGMGMHIHPSNSTHHLSPNYNSSTIPMSSPGPNQKISIDSHSEIYNSPNNVNILFTNKSPYTRSGAILSPNRHNSIRESNSKSPQNCHNNMETYMIYNDTQNIDNIPDIPPSDKDYISVHYDDINNDAHIDEKQSTRKVSSNISKYRTVSSQMYGIHQPDVFPDEEDDEGDATQTMVQHKEGYNSHNDNKSIKAKSVAQSVGYNNLKQIENHLIFNNNNKQEEHNYNSSSDQDEDEKNTQNKAT